MIVSSLPGYFISIKPSANASSGFIVIMLPSGLAIIKYSTLSLIHTYLVLLVYTSKTKYVWISDNVEYLIIAKPDGNMITIKPEDALADGFILMKYPGKDDTIMLTEKEYNLVFLGGEPSKEQQDFKIKF